jgi:hypothetical protein
VVLTWFFLKHIRDEAVNTREMLKGFHGDHILARKETTEAVQANTIAMNKNTDAVKELIFQVNKNRQ